MKTLLKKVILKLNKIYIYFLNEFHYTATIKVRNTNNAFYEHI